MFGNLASTQSVLGFLIKFKRINSLLNYTVSTAA